MNSKFLYEYVPATDPMFNSPGHAFTDINIINVWMDEELQERRKKFGLPLDNLFDLRIESYVTDSFKYENSDFSPTDAILLADGIRSYTYRFVMETRHVEKFIETPKTPIETKYFINTHADADRMPLFIKGHIPEPGKFCQELIAFVFDGRVPDLTYIDIQKAKEFFALHNKPILRKLNNKDKRKGY